MFDIVKFLKPKQNSDAQETTITANDSSVNENMTTEDEKEYTPQQKIQNVNQSIEIYSVSNPALEDYRKYAKEDNYIDKDILEKKLTAIIINLKETRTMLNNKHVYRFGDMIIIVNESTKKIEVINWEDEFDKSMQISYILRRKIEKTYNELGLNIKGNDYIDPDDEEKHRLSNEEFLVYNFYRKLKNSGEIKLLRYGVWLREMRVNEQGYLVFNITIDNVPVEMDQIVKIKGSKYEVMTKLPIGYFRKIGFTLAGMQALMECLKRYYKEQFNEQIDVEL